MDTDKTVAARGGACTRCPRHPLRSLIWFKTARVIRLALLCLAVSFFLPAYAQDKAVLWADLDARIEEYVALPAGEPGTDAENARAMVWAEIEGIRARLIQLGEDIDRTREHIRIRLRELAPDVKSTVSEGVSEPQEIEFTDSEQQRLNDLTERTNELERLRADGSLLLDHYERMRTRFEEEAAAIRARAGSRAGAGPRPAIKAGLGEGLELEAAGATAAVRIVAPSRPWRLPKEMLSETEFQKNARRRTAGDLAEFKAFLATIGRDEIRDLDTDRDSDRLDVYFRDRFARYRKEFTAYRQNILKLAPRFGGNEELARQELLKRMDADGADVGVAGWRSVKLEQQYVDEIEKIIGNIRRGISDLDSSAIAFLGSRAFRSEIDRMELFLRGHAEGMAEIHDRYLGAQDSLEARLRLKLAKWTMQTAIEWDTDVKRICNDGPGSITGLEMALLWRLGAALNVGERREDYEANQFESLRRALREGLLAHYDDWLRSQFMLLVLKQYPEAVMGGGGSGFQTSFTAVYQFWNDYANRRLASSENAQTGLIASVLDRFIGPSIRRGLRRSLAVATFAPHERRLVDRKSEVGSSSLFGRYLSYKKYKSYVEDHGYFAPCNSEATYLELLPTAEAKATYMKQRDARAKATGELRRPGND